MDVAVHRTKPECVLDDVQRLVEEAGFQEALPKDLVTILKDNISWHLPYLSANTTPWQLEGVIRALKDADYREIVVVHNNTVVTNPYKGGSLNKLTPIYQKYGINEKYNFKPEDIDWITYHSKARMKVLDKIYPEGIKIPEYFIGKNIMHLPTIKTHIYTTTTQPKKS